LDSRGVQPLRAAFVADLDELKAQVEVMAVKVDDALQRSTAVLLMGDSRLAADVIAGDDDIDAMLVSLTERCYDLLVRQSPVASDLRLVVSVLRILSDLERTGDLCLRIVKLVGHQPLLASHPPPSTSCGQWRARRRGYSALHIGPGRHKTFGWRIRSRSATTPWTRTT
jgi:hypothetical protein